MSRTSKPIQYLIVFATLLGVLFLWEVYGVLPAAVFDFVALGWVLFVFDSFLTFVRPAVAYYLGLVLSVAGLAASLPQSAHYTLLETGMLLQAATFALGSAAEALIIVLVIMYYVRGRKKDEWAWPGAK